MEAHLLQPLCRQRRPRATGAVHDQLLPRREDIHVNRTVRVGVEFQPPARGVNGAGNLTVALQFWEIAYIDKDDAFLVEVLHGVRH